MKTQTPYTLVHTVFLLCQIMLHREYVPFIPLRCKKPEGPLDPPLFPPEKYDVPTGFWEDSARNLFRAARSIMDLVRTCQEWNALVETPIVGFAIYTVAFTGVYGINFSWMDPDGYMCTKPSATLGGKSVKVGESQGFEAARKALEMIGQMRPRMHMAGGWFDTINRMHKYFRRIRIDYNKNVQEPDAPHSDGDAMSTSTSSRQLSLREGGTGGGLDEYKLLERTLTEFGNLEDQDVDMSDERQGSKPLDGVYDESVSGTTVKSEDMERAAPAEQPRSDGQWNAVNIMTGAQRDTISATPTTNGQFRSYESYQHPTAAQAPLNQCSSYTQSHVNGFRPSYTPNDGSLPPPGAPPSLTSPQSRTASTPSQPSPPFDNQQHRPYNNQWPSQNQPYAMPPPPLAQHNYHQHPAPQNSQSTTPIHNMHVYPTPGPQSDQVMAPPPQHLDHNQQVWGPMAKQAWFDNMPTSLGGDDLAVFADGGEMHEWASMAGSRGYDPGWLGVVWEPPSRPGHG
jgi:hypothetical protein